MKKLLIVLITIAFSTSLVSTKAKAQLFAKNEAVASEVLKPALENKDEAKKAAMLTAASIKATRHFEKGFHDAPGVSWYKSDKVIVASFSKDEKQTHVVYDRKGRWIRTTYRYQADKLPGDIISSVSYSGYGCYKITLVQEIQEPSMSFYVIHLENENTFKEVTVYEGEVKLLNNINKR